MFKKLKSVVNDIADILDDFIHSPLSCLFITICIYVISAIIQWDEIVSIHVYYFDYDILNATVKEAICVAWDTTWNTVKLFLIPTIIASFWIVFHTIFGGWNLDDLFFLL